MWYKLKTRDFLQDQSGSMVTFFAVASTCLLMGVAAAVEINGLTQKKAALQQAADSAVIAAAVSGEVRKPVLRKIAYEAAESNFVDQRFLLTLRKDDDKYNVELETEHELLWMGMFGRKTRTIHAVAASEAGIGGKVNIALALDTTRSMDGDRIAALKDVANDFIKSVEKADKGNGNVKIGVVPFANYVRIDTAYEGESWLDIPPDRVQRWQTVDWDASTGCRRIWVGERHVTRCTNTVYKDREARIRWRGCMGSRPDGHHATTAYGGNKFKGLAGSGACTSRTNIMLPLTTELDDVKGMIDSLHVEGETYLPAGLQWAARLLQEEALFTDEEINADSEAEKVLLLMTDGSNTASLRGNISGWDGRYHWGTDDDAEDQEIADELTAQMCESIKADNVRIVTVAFQVDDSDTKTLLKSCASKDSDFYDAVDAKLLKSAFTEIGAGFSQIRLTK